jgi:hypothetical protein
MSLKFSIIFVSLKSFKKYIKMGIIFFNNAVKKLIIIKWFFERKYVLSFLIATVKLGDFLKEEFRENFQIFNKYKKA